jgi:hypothetical protein
VVFYLLAMATMFVCALGPEPRLFGRPILYEPPYAWLMRVPGFDTLRVPARFAMLFVLCQCVLLALAVARWSSRQLRPQLVEVPLRGAAVVVLALQESDPESLADLQVGGVNLKPALFGF